MTKFLEIDKKELLENKGLLILQELLDCCEESGIQKIRYSFLKKRCNDRLNSLSDGTYTDLGGTFENYISKFESKLDLSKRFLQRIQEPNKTFIIPDILKIKAYLATKKVKGSFDRRDWSENIVDQRLIEKAARHIAIDSIQSKKLSHLANPIDKIQDSFMKQAGSEISAYLSSHFLRITYSCPEDKNINLNEEEIMPLLIAGNYIASYDMKTPFKIILEYKGLFDDASSMETGLTYVQKLAEYFKEWAKNFHKVEITQEQMKNITNNQLELVDDNIRNLFTEFYSILFSYLPIFD